MAGNPAFFAAMQKNQQNNGSPAADSAKNGPKHKKHKHMKAAIAQRLKKVQGK